VYELSDKLRPLASSFDKALEYFTVQFAPKEKIRSDLMRFGKSNQSWDVGGIFDRE
jgi:hypothetical protein